MEKLWKFTWDVGRMGTVECVFIATEEDIDKIIGKEVYFGEILGKHSEIFGTVEEDEIVLLSDNQEVVKVLKESIGTTISGYNPIEYWEERQEDEEDDWDED